MNISWVLRINHSIITQNADRPGSITVGTRDYWFSGAGSNLGSVGSNLGGAGSNPRGVDLERRGRRRRRRGSVTAKA